MPNDVLIDFYLASVKVQLYEYRFFNSKVSGDQYAELLHEIEVVRRQLGDALCKLLTSALPSLLRDPRDFRAKYTEEVDLRNLERCLVAAANRVISYSSTNSPRDFDLRSAQPAASEFLDILSQVQCLVSNVIELGLAAVDKDNLPRMDNTTSSHQISLTECSPDATGHHHVSPASSRIAESLVSSFVTSSLLQESEAASCKPGTSSTDTSRPDAPHLASTSLSIRDDSRGLCTLAVVEIKAGPDVYRQSLRLPPSSSLYLPEELCARFVDLDKAAANFELEFVRCLSRRLRTRQEAMDLQFVTVLFSETLMWGLAVRLFSMQQLADRDPSVFLSLPRLAVLVGTRILPDSPIGANRLAAGLRLPFMFAGSRTDLAYLARQLYALRLDQLCRLARWLGPRGLPNLIAAEQRKQQSSPIRNASQTLLCGHKTSASNSPPLHTAPDSSHRAPSHPMFSSNWSGNYTPQTVRTWRTNLSGLHQLYKRLSAVADEFSTKFPTELRYILQICFELHDTSNSDAAMAQLEGASAPDHLSSDNSESTGTELDGEVALCEHSTNKHLTSLAQLFDWCNVVGKRHSKEGSMYDILKFCCSHFEPKSELPENVTAAGKPPCVLLDPTMENMALEFGLDVAAVLAPLTKPIAFGEDETCLYDYLNQTRASTGAENSNQRLGKLNFGVSVEGVQNRGDQLLHYLPAWQPDRLPDGLNEVNSVGYDTDSDPDPAVDDDDNEVDQTNVFVVGRQCATCLQPFTLFRRRHHCRRCGHIFCAYCCNSWQTVEGLATSKPVRVCSECFQFLTANS